MVFVSKQAIPKSGHIGIYARQKPPRMWRSIGHNQLALKIRSAAQVHTTTSHMVDNSYNESKSRKKSSETSLHE